MPYDEDVVESIIDRFRLFFSNVIMTISEQEYEAVITLLISELENMPTFEDLY